MSNFLLAAALAQTAPIAPPMPQESADCVHPVYATDQLVCGDPALRALDDRLAELLKQLSTRRSEGRWIEDQSSWFRRSRLCAFQEKHTGCIAGAYRERISVLASLTVQVPPGAGRCVLVANEARAILVIENHNVVAVGISARPSPDPVWRPFVSFDPAKRISVLRDLTGTIIAKCPAATHQE